RPDVHARAHRGIEVGKAPRQALQRGRADFIEPQFAHLPEQGQTDGAHPRVELRDAGVVRDLAPQLIDDERGDLEVALSERTGRIMHRRAAEGFHDAVGARDVLERAAENRIAALTLGTEPQTCRWCPSRSAISASALASGSAVALLATSTTWARCERRSTTTCR